MLYSCIISTQVHMHVRVRHIASASTNKGILSRNNSNYIQVMRGDDNVMSNRAFRLSAFRRSSEL